MTILDASNLIFQWLTKNDSINIKRDFNKIILISEDINNDKSCLEMALSEYVDSKLLKEKNGYFILQQSFASFTQKIEITPVTAIAISEVINKFCRIVQNKTDLCEAKQIKEKDIQNLISIIANLSEAGSAKTNE